MDPLQASFCDFCGTAAVFLYGLNFKGSVIGGPDMRRVNHDSSPIRLSHRDDMKAPFVFIKRFMRCELPKEKNDTYSIEYGNE